MNQKYNSEHFAWLNRQTKTKSDFVMVTQRGGIFFIDQITKPQTSVWGPNHSIRFNSFILKWQKEKKNKNTSLNVAKNPVDVDGVGKKLPQ